jgi:recombination protein RecT
MTTQNSVTKTAAQPVKLDAAGVLDKYKNEIARALPSHMTPDRVARIALTEVRKNPKLAACDPFSFLGAVVQAAQLGLEVGSGLGHAYLVPYKSECTLITGYKGQVDLMRRSGRIKGVWSYIVYPEDTFEEGVDNGEPYLRYQAARTGKERKPEDEMRAVFALAKFDDGTTQWSVMEKWEVDRIRAGLRYPSDVWRDHYGEMAKKTAVRRLSKLCPQSPELVQANEIEDGGRRAHQPFIDVQVLPESYETKQGTIGEMAEAKPGEHRLAHEQKADDEKKDLALADFRDTASAYAEKGGDVVAAIKHDPKTVATWDIARIQAATEILKIKMKGQK